MAAATSSYPSIAHGPCLPRPLEMTFGQLLQLHAEARGDSLAVISHAQDRSISFRQLHERSTDLAKAMENLGVRKGDLVAIVSGSRIEYLEIFFACAKLGAALVLLNYAYTESEMLALLKSIGPKVLFTPPGFARYDYTSSIPKILQGVPRLSLVVLLTDIFRKYTLRPDSLDKIQDYEELIECHRSLAWRADPSISPHDMVNVQFTSGSTGLPKSVALSHYNIMNCGRYIGLQTRMSANDRICCPVPLFHSFGMIVGISTSAVVGSTLVLPSELFDAAKSLECVARYRCTAIYGVTTMFMAEMTSSSFERTDRSSLRWGISAGSAMPPEFLRRVMTGFPISRLYSCWGMTELSSLVTMTHETDPWEKRIRTAGRLFPNFALKIVKPNTGEVLPWGEKGEIVVSGYGQMSGYLGNAAKTQEALRHHREDLRRAGAGGLGEDGSALRRWMHTGDEGLLDEDGYLVITGRIKDLIIRGGENISPVEIEERLIENPAVEQASVIGVPDDRYGETVGAFLESRAGCRRRPDDGDIKDWVRKELSYFKAPAHIWWIGGPDERVPREWPKTMSGKISKPHLRKAAEQLLPSRANQPGGTKANV